MLTTAHQAALEVTTNEVYISIASSIDTSDAGTLDILATEILHHVRLSLTAHLRKRNRDTLALERRLPVELWESIWLALSTKERIHISHVSSDWRANVLSCPSLWCDIQYTSSAPYSPDLVHTFLERSRGMPFDLKLDIENVEEGADLNLSNIVLPHHQRMASVYGTVQDPLSFQTFLSLFTSLPSLRRIGLTSRMTDAELVREEPLLLPMLSSLALYGRLTCGENFLFLCPATSSVTSMFNNSGHILRLLRACPSAAKWVLQIGSRQAVAADEDMDEVHNLLSAAQIQSLEIGRAYRVDVEPCLKMFAPAMIARFDIACANTEGIYGSDLERHLLQNNEQATFSHLECVLFYENRDQAKISLESNGGSRRRSVTLIVGEDDDGAFRACLRLVARVLATGPVTSARITSSFWPSIFQQSTDQYEILATSIIVEFDGDDVDDWMSLCAAAEPTRFVRLEHLTLRAASGKPSLKASDPFVVNFSRVFGVDRMLHKLVIEGISLTGDVDCLVGKVAVEVELATSAQS